MDMAKNALAISSFNINALIHLILGPASENCEALTNTFKSKLDL